MYSLKKNISTLTQQYLIGALIFIMTVAVCVAPNTGDTLNYASDAVNAHDPLKVGSFQKLWEFGHLLWRPLAALLTPIVLSIVNYLITKHLQRTNLNKNSYFFVPKTAFCEQRGTIILLSSTFTLQTMTPQKPASSSSTSINKIADKEDCKPAAPYKKSPVTKYQFPSNNVNLTAITDLSLHRVEAESNARSPSI